MVIILANIDLDHKLPQFTEPDLDVTSTRKSRDSRSHVQNEEPLRRSPNPRHLWKQYCLVDLVLYSLLEYS